MHHRKGNRNVLTAWHNVHDVAAELLARAAAAEAAAAADRADDDGNGMSATAMMLQQRDAAPTGNDDAFAMVGRGTINAVAAGKGKGKGKRKGKGKGGNRLSPEETEKLDKEAQASSKNFITVFGKPHGEYMDEKGILSFNQGKASTNAQVAAVCRVLETFGAGGVSGASNQANQFESQTLAQTTLLTPVVGL